MSKVSSRLKFFIPFHGRIRLIKRFENLQVQLAEQQVRLHQLGETQARLQAEIAGHEVRLHQLDAHQTRLQQLETDQVRLYQLMENLNVMSEFKEQVLAEVYESRMQTIYNRLTEMISEQDEVLEDPLKNPALSL